MENSSIYADFNRTNSSASEEEEESLRCPWPAEDNKFVTSLEHFPALWISIFVRPTVILLGTVGNAIVFSVQLRDKRKSTTNVYLAVMSVSGFFILWSAFPDYVLLVLSRSGAAAKVWESYPSCERFHGPLMWLQYSAVWIADCTLVVFSVERLLCTMNPIRYLNFFTMKRALHLEMSVVVMSALWNLHYIVFYHYKPHLTPLHISWGAIMVKTDAFRCVCTWLVLMVTNVTLVRALAKHSRARKEMLATSSAAAAAAAATAHQKPRSRNRTSSILLLCSAVIYSITQFPFIVYALLVMAAEPPHCWINISARDAALCLVFGGNLSVLGYSIDCVVFYCSSAGFRRQLEIRCTIIMLMLVTIMPRVNASMNSSSDVQATLTVPASSKSPIVLSFPHLLETTTQTPRSIAHCLGCPFGPNTP
ncbi:hypothetical protein BV898_14756 [Hypsibius exemplaris]|uniref:G-protein coupled receptors family 1 profile domain-containing protein n=1 Tax=Hypsibius exemplaris TaxID=2072580 RepID=A0A9X6NBJ1_HYPEX|nr:hypothetical protein BV898_14756 [Hypsibius exemplaris]